MSLDENALHRRLVAAVPGVGPLDTSSKDPCVELPPSALVDAVRFLRDDPECAFEMLHCVTAVDRPERVDVVYHLCSLSRHHALTLRTSVARPADADGDWHPAVPSVTSVYPSANWHEREQWDLLGVRFTGHPDLRRILLPQEWIGHPLRKDYVYPSEHDGIPLELDAIPLYERGSTTEVPQPAAPREPGTPLRQPPSEYSTRPHAGGKAPITEEGQG